MARLEIKLKEMELRVETREGEERKVICFTSFWSYLVVTLIEYFTGLGQNKIEIIAVTKKSLKKLKCVTMQ